MRSEWCLRGRDTALTDPNLPPGWQTIAPTTVGANWIDQAVRNELAGIPESSTAAVVAVVDLNGARLAAMAKIGADWEAQVYLDHEWSGDNQAGARVVWHN